MRPAADPKAIPQVTSTTQPLPTMNRIDIQLGDLSPSAQDTEKPVRLQLSPQPPAEWETLLFTKWLEAQGKSGKYPEMSVVNGIVTLACRVGDYRQFFHEELEQKVTEANEIYTRQLEEAALRLAEEEKAALLQPAEERVSSGQRMREIAAFNELQRLRGGWVKPEPATSIHG
jgi:hypothetical protein